MPEVTCSGLVRRRRRGGKVLGIAAAAALGTALSGVALAEPGDTCVSGFERGQELQKQGKQVKARAELRLCAGACPEMLAVECRKWLADAEAKIGRLRVEPKDAQGHPVAKAVVRIDDIEATSAETEVDPGAHTVQVQADGYLIFQKSIDVAAGATVPVQVALSPEPTPQQVPLAPEPSFPRKPVAIGLGAVGIAGILSGVSLLVYGKVEEGRLSGSCHRSCSPDAVAGIERAWIAGGVALGAGALLAAGALLMWPPSPRTEPPSPAKSAGLTFRVWIDTAGGGGLVGTGDF